MEEALSLNPEAALITLMWASIRTGAALALLPAFGGRLIPGRVRIGLAGAMGLLALGGPHAPTPPVDILSFASFVLIFGELLIGATIAMALHAAFATAITAGEWMAQAMGLGFSTMVDPMSGPTPVLSTMMAMLMWAIFLGSGGHLVVFELLHESYRTIPTAAVLMQPDRLMEVVSWGSYAIISGLIAALPLGTTLLLVNLSLAVAARSSPQLNLFSVGFPMMLMSGIACLPLALPGIAESLSNVLTDMQLRAAGVILG